MRRLVLALAVLCSLVLTVTGGAIAARTGSHLTIKGVAHASGGKLRGGFTVENTGTAKAPALTATVKVVGAEPNSKVLTKSIVQRAAIGALAAGAKQRVKVKASVPKRAKTGNWSIVACAGQCVKIGKLTGADDGPRQEKATSPSAPAPPVASTLSLPAPPAPPTPPAAPVLCPTPSAPLAYTVGEPFRHAGCGVEYWGLVPASYSPATPAPLLIWLHGCGGESGGDIYTVSPAAAEEPQDWISLTLIGREEPNNECWIPSVDETKVLQALADVESHLDINTRRVILGGYSSGGDLSYRTGFRHSSTFAGLLIENSSPFRDTDSTEAESLAAATTKLHIVHLAHLQDGTSPIAGVRAETEALEAAGFPLERIEVPGEHWNDEGDGVDGHVVPGTDADLRDLLLPHIDDGWLAPAT